MKRMNTPLLTLLGVLALAHLVVSGTVEAAASGTLHVPISGFASDRGRVFVKLFVRGDNVPRGRGTREEVARVVGRKALVEFANLPHGNYALFVFHDENENGTLDHNLLGMPSEAIGFSNGFRVTLFSGIPDFEDLKFTFSQRHTAESIRMKR